MVFRHPLSTQRILLPHSPPQFILHHFVILEQLYNHSTTVYLNVAYIAEFPKVAYILDRSGTEQLQLARTKKAPMDYWWYGHTCCKSMNQPGKVVNPARGQLNREINISLSAFAPENLVSRDGSGSLVPRQPTHLHTQAESGA